ncbi:MAG: hypothetical protein ACR2GH_13265 [Pseudonocardia sp.]
MPERRGVLCRYAVVDVRDEVEGQGVVGSSPDGDASGQHRQIG